jgi:hypothetical protein
MSATTEMITEQIAQLKERISFGRRSGTDVSDLELKVSELSRQLMSAAALNESKNILKG